jgi:crotonobetainyl-CoA:carnitine CoA-transferase CaiB-like acyl-CoA transferase
MANQTLPLEGVAVLELSEFVMGPSAAAILADWGAEVIKIEHPSHGDRVRGVLRGNGHPDAFNFYFEQNNRSKRSVGIDAAKPEGRQLIKRLIERCDVFVTSLSERTRQVWGLTYEDVVAIQPTVVYARTSGQGLRGPDGELPGFDATSYWARSSMGYMVTEPGADQQPMPAGGFGDMMGGLALAGGVAAALVRSRAQGAPVLVDSALLGVGCWAMYEGLEVVDVLGIDPKTQFRVPLRASNPLTSPYRTSDGRWIALCLIDPVKFWPGLVRALGREALIEDPRFRGVEERAVNKAALRRELERAFAERTTAQAIADLRAGDVPFSLFQTPGELLHDPQLRANGFLIPHATDEDRFLVASPVQFNETTVAARRPAPEVGQHTEEVLLEAGLSWDEISDLKDRLAIT